MLVRPLATKSAINVLNSLPHFSAKSYVNVFMASDNPEAMNAGRLMDVARLQRRALKGKVLRIVRV